MSHGARGADQPGAWLIRASLLAGEGRGGFGVWAWRQPLRASCVSRFRAVGCPSARSRLRLACAHGIGASCSAASRPQRTCNVGGHDITVEPPASGDERTPTSFERGCSDPLGRRDRGEGGSPRPASPSTAPRMPRRKYDAAGCESAGARPDDAGRASASREERVLVVAVQRVVETCE